MTVDYNGHTFERLGHASVRITTSNDQIIYIDPWTEVLAASCGSRCCHRVRHAR
jgi:L-ascorbate metabolism protein UlaG (beta-lactamase superfamily)